MLEKIPPVEDPEYRGMIGRLHFSPYEYSAINAKEMEYQSI